MSRYVKRLLDFGLIMSPLQLRIEWEVLETEEMETQSFHSSFHLGTQRIIIFCPLIFQMFYSLHVDAVVCSLEYFYFLVTS